jgi:uncharacterized membrane protein (UPF0127 family)
LALVVLGGCRGDAPGAGTTAVFRGMAVTTLRLATPSGREIRLDVRVADDDEERSAGFQRIAPEVIARSRILFVFPKPVRSEFHMQNVAAPLDIAFFARDGKIRTVMTMVPGPETYGPWHHFQYVLEAPGGSFAKEGIVPGVRMVAPPGLPASK